MKTVLVTGANRGIGREVANQLAARGCHVFVGARSVAGGREAADEIVRRGGKATFLEIDIANAASVEKAAREFDKVAGHLDVLVNNAATMALGDHRIFLLAEDVLRTNFETNVFGTLRVTRAFMPMLSESREPRIINVSSGGARLTGPRKGWATGYCVSKTAQNGITVQLAHALPNFAVNAISPGWVKTRMGGPTAPLSVQEGADTIVWAALDAPQSLTGKFLERRQETPW
jgi:NAD(P)-dependent dehydrogenase (short-subunit alcohol dehydrogenase family)